MRELLVYTPDKAAGFGQAFRFRKARDAATALQHFRESCTGNAEPKDLNLVTYRATEWDDDRVAASIIERVVDKFGSAYSEDALGYKWPSGEKLKGGRLVWSFKSEVLPELVEFLSSNEPWPKQALGPVEVQCSFRFQWTDPDTGVILPGQQSGNATPDGSIWSSLLISLGRSQFAQPDFWFPFPEGSPKFSTFLQKAAHFIPFTLNNRHFRAAIPKRDGSGYVFRKVVLPPHAV